jgi:ketosteroid isomerase-like protein
MISALLESPSSPKQTVEIFAFGGGREHGMSHDNQDIAMNFSRHRFDHVIPHFADDIQWDIVGGDRIAGKDSVARICSDAANDLSRTTVTYVRNEVVVGEHVVAVDTLAEYRDHDGEVSVIASCDLLTFTDDKVSVIRSYTIEVDAG